MKHLQKEYSKNYHATFMRDKRKKMIEQDPLYMRKCVWIVEAGDKQIAFLNKRDIHIYRINKEDIKPNCIKTF